MTRRRGVTLPELMVASSLMMALLGVLYVVLSRGLRVMHRADADTRAQQQATLATERVFSALGYSDYRTLTVLSNPSAISFLSLDPPRQAGLPVLGSADYFLLANFTHTPWLKFTAFYLQGPKLLRREFPYGGGTQLASIPVDLLANVLIDPRYPSTLVAQGIERFEATRTNTPGLVRLVVVARHDWDRPRITRLETTLALRN